MTTTIGAEEMTAVDKLKRALILAQATGAEFRVEGPGYPWFLFQADKAWPFAHCYQNEPHTADLLAKLLNAAPLLMAVAEAAQAHVELHDHPNEALRMERKADSWARLRAALGALNEERKPTCSGAVRLVRCSLDAGHSGPCAEK